MNKTIVVKLPVVWLFVIVVLLAAVLLGTGAATSDKKEDTWAITFMPKGDGYPAGRMLVLNQKSGNLYSVEGHRISQYSSLSRSDIDKVGNLKDAGAL